MRPLKRSGVSKQGAAAKFKRGARHAKAANVQMGPMRGGWRL